MGVGVDNVGAAARESSPYFSNQVIQIRYLRITMILFS